jgi:type II secretory pathway component PulF
MISNFTHKHLFYLEMAKLLGAGFGIREAAGVMADMKLPPEQAVLLKDLNHGLDAGHSITDAFSRDTSVISELERTMIRAGERGGNLAIAFQHLSEYFGVLATARADIWKGMIYPLVVLHMGIFIAVVPTAMMHGEGVLRILSEFVVTLLVAYGMALVAFVMIRTVFRAAPNSSKIDGILDRVPFLGKARKNLAMARFCKVYHSCLLAGISMNETVALATSAAQSGLLTEAGKNVLVAAQSGSALGPFFIEEDAYPRAFARSYSSGEQAGTLDKDLARWADLFQADAAASIKTLSAAVPKVLYFFILIFVGWKIVSFFNGYYSGIINQLDS